MKPLVEIRFRLRTLGFDPGPRAIAATLVCFRRYLNARRLICWSDEVIAHLFEIEQLTCNGASDLESEGNERVPSATNQVDEDQASCLCLAHFGVLDFARILVGHDRNCAVGLSKALWRL